MKPVHFRDRVAAYLKARPDQWVNATELEAIGGRFAWRTRVSECRTQLGLTIENRVRTVKRPDGTQFRISEYLLVPSDKPDPIRFTAEGQGVLL